jgi:hypothetical protein
MDPELPRLVIRRGDHATAVWIPADDKRLRPQLRALELLDCGEECVEVDVGDDHSFSLEPPSAFDGGPG